MRFEQWDVLYTAGEICMELRLTRGFFLEELIPYVQLAKNIPFSCLLLADFEWEGSQQAAPLGCSSPALLRPPRGYRASFPY